jgi:hypothetical protein
MVVKLRPRAMHDDTGSLGNGLRTPGAPPFLRGSTPVGVEASSVPAEPCAYSLSEREVTASTVAALLTVLSYTTTGAPKIAR